jgi:hypothetical protein
MFQIRRSGNFTCLLEPGAAHCGIRNHANNFDYDVKIAIDDDALNHRGFVMDNQEIDLYFQTIKSTAESCEQLSLQAAKHFWNQLTESIPGQNKKLRGAKVLKLEISIWGMNKVACLDYIYDRSMGHPAPDGQIYPRARRPAAV